MGCGTSSEQMRDDETPAEYMVRRQYARYANMSHNDQNMFLLHMRTYNG